MTDFFDAVLNLEEEYYTLGHQEGTLAGATAGRLEGRAFGIEKGFEKYVCLGMIKGRTKVWQARIPPTSSISQSPQPPQSQPAASQEENEKEGKETSEHRIPSKLSTLTNPRQVKHVQVLQTLTSNPPIRNEEDDVEEVDDRIRRGKAKVKILENILKEGVPDDEDGEKGKDGEGKISKRLAAVAISGAAGMETEVEDFKIRRS